MSNKVVKRDIAEPMAYDPNAISVEDLWAEADIVHGTDLLNEGLQDALVNVPFVITKVNFYPGITRDGKDSDFVSIEAVIGSEEMLKKRRIDLTSIPFGPGDSVVFNDGGTGIRRQIVEYLSVKGYITLTEGEITPNGRMGESTYDYPASGWKEIHAGLLHYRDDGAATYEANVRIGCPRGLRISKYTNPVNPRETVTTRYLA